MRSNSPHRSVLPVAHRRQLAQREQQLAAAFAQLAHLLAELLGDLDHLVADVEFARLPQVIFVVGLDADGRQHRNQQQNQDAAAQPDAQLRAPAGLPRHGCRRERC